VCSGPAALREIDVSFVIIYKIELENGVDSFKLDFRRMKNNLSGITLH
jgi:hypothetical protein